MRALVVAIGVVIGCNPAPNPAAAIPAPAGTAPTAIAAASTAAPLASTPDPAPQQSQAVSAAPPPPPPPIASADPDEKDTAPGTYLRPPGCPEPGATLDAAAKRAPHIPGTLVIRPPDLEAPSHGVGDGPRRAIFCLRNLTGGPLRVRVGSLLYVTDHPGVAEADRRQPQAFRWGIADNARKIARDGQLEVTLPPGRWFALELWADMPNVYAHVAYAHEATFTVGLASMRGRGALMMFRPPHHW